jgi:FixJ family two-component response regulator
MMRNGTTLARWERSALGLRMGEAAVVHIIDDDESMRAALDSLLRSVGLGTCAYASVSEFLVTQRPDAAGCLILGVVAADAKVTQGLE